MRSIKFLAVAAAIILTGAACSSTDDGGAVTPPPTDGNTVVGTTDNTFEPAELTVAVGDTVDWTWTDAIGGHNVKGVDNDLDSGDPTEDGEYSFTFDTAGTYSYYCTIHGTAEGAGMAGTITVA